MAYPPSIPTNARLNTTPQVDNHPADHNALSNALTDIVNELGSNPSAGFADLTARLNAAVEAGSPVGVLYPFLGPAAPSGYALCVAGATASRSAYPKLFALWGVRFGAGNGSTTFGLPDMSSVPRTVTAAATTSMWGQAAGNNNAIVVDHSHQYVDYVRNNDGIPATAGTYGLAPYWNGNLEQKLPIDSTYGASNAQPATDANMPAHMTVNWIVRLA